MTEFVYYNELYQIYGFMLTDKQKEIFELYYSENLSLSEIADELKVSRSYAGKIVDDTRKKLDYYEDNIGHYKLLKELKK